MCLNELYHVILDASTVPSEKLIFLDFSGLGTKIKIGQNTVSTLPKNPHIYFSLIGGGMSKIDLILNMSTSIPLSLTRNPINFVTFTLKVHFSRFCLRLNFLICSKNFLNFFFRCTPKVHSKDIEYVNFFFSP